MFEHEYNPVHVHQGTLFTGLSSVMILKLPPSFGVEYSAAEQPQNGRLTNIRFIYLVNLQYRLSTRN
jgi:hypothetical protein